MNRSTVIVLIAGLSVATTALASHAAEACSIHPPKGASKAKLMSMAKRTRGNAERIALKRIKERGTVAEGELEAERGCLIWSFDIKVAGRAGVEEVNVDAGNGKVLNVHHESANQKASGQ